MKYYLKFILLINTMNCEIYNMYDHNPNDGPKPQF